MLVSVTVRDKKGALVRGLKQSDFTVLEDGKPQRIQSFDIEDVDNYVPSLRRAAPRRPKPRRQRPIYSPAGKRLRTKRCRIAD